MWLRTLSVFCLLLIGGCATESASSMIIDQNTQKVVPGEDFDDRLVLAVGAIDAPGPVVGKTSLRQLSIMIDDHLEVQVTGLVDHDVVPFLFDQQLYELEVLSFASDRRDVELGVFLVP